MDNQSQTNPNDVLKSLFGRSESFSDFMRKFNDAYLGLSETDETEWLTETVGDSVYYKKRYFGGYDLTKGKVHVKVKGNTVTLTYNIFDTSKKYFSETKLSSTLPEDAEPKTLTAKIENGRWLVLRVKKTNNDKKVEVEFE